MKFYCVFIKTEAGFTPSGRAARSFDSDHLSLGAANARKAELEKGLNDGETVEISFRKRP